MECVKINITDDPNYYKTKKWKEYHRIYKEDYNKEYYKKNRDKFYQKINCPCGGKYLYCNKSTHKKSMKHQKYKKGIENLLKKL